MDNEYSNYADNKYSYQTARMRRLISVSVGHMSEGLISHASAQMMSMYIAA